MHRFLVCSIASFSVLGFIFLVPVVPPSSASLLGSAEALEDDWSDAERLTDDFADSEAPSIATDFLGDVHVVWYDTRPGNGEVYAKHRGSFSWTEDERVTDAPGNSPWPRVAADPLGNLHAVWYDYRPGDPQIYYARWDGVDWSEAELVSEGPSWAVSPDVATDPFGNVHVVWYDDRSGSWEIYYRMWNGLLWLPEVQLTDSHVESRYPRIAYDPTGRIHVVWQEEYGGGNWEIHHTSWDGVDWSEVGRLTDEPGSSLRPHLACAPDGTVHLVWHDDRTGPDEVYYLMYDGIAWTNETRISTLDGHDSFNPAIASDHVGNLHVTWQDKQLDITHSDVFYTWSNRAVWAEATPLTDGTSESANPSIATNVAGTVHLVWQDDRDGNTEIYYSSKPLSGVPPIAPVLTGIVPPISWNFGSRDLTARGRDFIEPATLLLIHEEGTERAGTTLEMSQSSLTARFDLTGTPVGDWSVVLISGNGLRDTLENRFETQTSPWTEEDRLTVDPSGSSLCYNSARPLVRDQDENLHLFWYDTRDGNQEIYWKVRTGDLWAPSFRLTIDPSSSSHPAAAASPVGPVLVAWQEGRAGNAEIYARLLVEGTWSDEMRVTDDPAPSTYPSVACDSEGRFHVAWQDARAGQWEVHYNIYDSGAWSWAHRLSWGAVTALHPTIACCDNGEIYVAWMDYRDGNWEIYARVFDGEFWENEFRVTDDAGESAYPSLMCNGNLVYLTWRDDRDGNQEIYLRRLDLFDPDERITEDEAASSYPTLVATDDHDIHVAWHDTRSGIDQIWFKSYNAQEGLWSLAHRVSDSSDEATLAGITVGPQGALDVVWRDSRDGNREIYHRARVALFPTGTPEAGSFDLSTLQVDLGPNPFRESVLLQLTVPAENRTILRVYDLHGRRVRDLLDRYVTPGPHTILWDGRDDLGRSVEAGIYFYKVTSGPQAQSGRLTRLR